MINPNDIRITKLKTKHNPYAKNAILAQVEFLVMAYSLMKKRVKRLKDIENSKNKDYRLPAAMLEEKFKITRNILQIINILQNDIKDVEVNSELINILFDIGKQISLGNISHSTQEAQKHYDVVILILDAFLDI